MFYHQQDVSLIDILRSEQTKFTAQGEILKNGILDAQRDVTWKRYRGVQQVFLPQLCTHCRNDRLTSLEVEEADLTADVGEIRDVNVVH